MNYHCLVESVKGGLYILITEPKIKSTFTYRPVQVLLHLTPCLVEKLCLVHYFSERICKSKQWLDNISDVRIEPHVVAKQGCYASDLTNIMWGLPFLKQEFV